MRWFKSRQREDLAIERLQDRLNALAERLDAAESTARKLELEWIETYDKVRHQLSRMARRGDLSKGSGNGGNVPPEGSEEPEMDPISASIHKRRSRSFLKGE